jgi:hypothetical protein
MSWKDQDIIKVLEDNKYYKFEVDSKGSKLIEHKGVLGWYDNTVLDKQELSDKFIIHSVEVMRGVSAKSSSRGVIREALIVSR